MAGVSVPPTKVNPGDTPLMDTSPQGRRAKPFDSCKAERYVYLASGLAGIGVLISLVVIFVQHSFTLAEVGMLSSSGGAIAFTANRILKIQHDVFRVVFGINL